MTSDRLRNLVEALCICDGRRLNGRARELANELREALTGQPDATAPASADETNFINDVKQLNEFAQHDEPCGSAPYPSPCSCGLQAIQGRVFKYIEQWHKRGGKIPSAEDLQKVSLPREMARELPPAAPPAQVAAEYHRGAKEAFQRVADEWPDSKQKAQTWANNCAVYEQQHRDALLRSPASTSGKVSDGH